jgi:hypothetical protein
LRRNRKTVFSTHDCALLAQRAAQNLDRRPSNGASALPRAINLGDFVPLCNPFDAFRGIRASFPSFPPRMMPL